MSEIDWNTELRKIEREFDGLPPEPSPGAVRARRAAERRAQQRKDDAAIALGAWSRLFLVVALGFALQLWPYPRACGLNLLAFMGAEAMVVVGGLWTVAWTWRFRMAKTHGLALLLVLWGVALLSAQVLPRVGYAKVDAQHPPRWWCSDPTPWAALTR